MFLVRAENSHGMSQPSAMSERVRTLRAPDDDSDDNVDMESVLDVLLSRVVELTSIEAISSTTIRVSWKMLVDSQYVEGFFVRYRLVRKSERRRKKTVGLI